MARQPRWGAGFAAALGPNLPSSPALGERETRSDELKICSSHTNLRRDVKNVLKTLGYCRQPLRGRCFEFGYSNSRIPSRKAEGMAPGAADGRQECLPHPRGDKKESSR